MQLTRQQFDVAVPGASVIAVVASAFLSLRLAAPHVVVGGLVVGIAFALRDGADQERKVPSDHGR